jgi:hypothetical protein
VNFCEEEVQKYGQRSWHFDVFGYGDHGTWAVECKKSCTLEQFGLALGQLIAYDYLLKDASVREKTEKKIREMAEIRGVELGEIKYGIEALDVPENSCGCVVAALVYLF